ncbi:hypothetical protein [Flagellimonas lutimaris]|uniref:hypothetical protein n=1 Tax=Flagellimonas lutimaris TaxID=475082 RepID=UPI0039C19828|tara:strand:+ start:2237 stop:2488 length:252 start_codon:yes stop_codon:yes gene_type:complete
MTTISFVLIPHDNFHYGKIETPTVSILDNLAFSYILFLILLNCYAIKYVSVFVCLFGQGIYLKNTSPASVKKRWQSFVGSAID